MAIAPKRKISKQRRNKRRASVSKLAMPAIVKCPRCGEYVRMHSVCDNCGHYKGREVIAKEA